MCHHCQPPSSAKVGTASDPYGVQLPSPLPATLRGRIEDLERRVEELEARLGTGVRAPGVTYSWSAQVDAEKPAGDGA